jgi:hypothetical protein
MSERRSRPRLRSYLGARVAFNARASTMDCLVRNISDEGARLVFAAETTLPQEFDLLVPHRKLEARARIVWRTGTEMGVTFLQASQAPATAEIVPISIARRLRDCETEKAALKRRIEGETLY